MIEELENIGLSPYEARCYVALLRSGPQKGKDLADKAEVPRTSVYPNLESLEKKGFITLIQKEPKIYLAKKPEIAIAAFIEGQSKMLKEKANIAIASSKDISSINPKTNHEGVELFVGSGQSYRAAKLLEEKTAKELLIIGSGSRSSAPGAAHNWIAASKRGVDIKVIFENTTGIPDIITQLKKNHIDVREHRFPNMALIISDRKITHYAIKSKELKEERLVMRVEHKDFSEAQVEFFNKIWKRAKKV